MEFKQRSLREAAGRPKGTPPQPRNRPEPIRVEKVKCLCGHEEDFPVYPDKNDRFRDQRRIKCAERVCSSCRQTTHKTKTEKDMREAKERRKNKPRRTPNWKLEAAERLTRLPHGSQFQTRYDHENMKWTGMLVVPENSCGNPERLVFSHEAPAVFRLLSELDAKFREYLREQAGKEKVTPAPERT